MPLLFGFTAGGAGLVQAAEPCPGLKHFPHWCLPAALPALAGRVSGKAHSPDILYAGQSGYPVREVTYTPVARLHGPCDSGRGAPLSEAVSL